MKSGIMRILVAVISSITLLGNIVAQEILKNNKFDDKGDNKIAAGWIDASWDLTSKPEFSIVNMDGMTAQKMTIQEIPSGRWGAFAQIVPELDSGLYKFQAKLKAENKLNVDVRVRRVRAPYNTFGAKSAVVDNSGWVDVTGFAFLTRPQKEVFFMVQQYQPGTLYIAGASLQKVDFNKLTKEEIDAVEAEFGPLIPPVDEKALLAETEARIIKNRTAPIILEITDAQGKPIPNQKVDVKHVKHLFYFGAGFERSFLRPDADEVELRHREAFLRLFNYSTVHLYWGWYEPRQGQYTHQVAIESARWLKEHGLTPRGHPIHWNHRAAVPRWVSDMNPDSDTFRKLLSQRVKQLSETVIPYLHDVDIFNELVGWNRFDNPFTRYAKERGLINMVADCVKEFKELNPNTLVAINDYETSPAYYRLLRDLIKAGVNFDYIGMQSHMHGGNWSFEQEWVILERLSRLNKPVLFTELSVLSGPRRQIDWSTERPLMDWSTDPEHEKIQADYLEKFYSIAYSHPNCIGIVMWNFTDRRSWLGAPVGVLRRDGTKKPSFDALDKLINEKWRTRGTFTTDNNGRIEIANAFEGEYTITVGNLTTNVIHSKKSPAKLKLTTSKQ